MKKQHLKTTACAALAASALFMTRPYPARAAKSTEVPVTIDYAASDAIRAPSVMIPKEISLKDELQCGYSVWAYCEKAELDILFDHVTIEPSETFTLTNERTGDTFEASVTQEKTEFLADEVKNGKEYDLGDIPVMRKGTEGTISIEGIPEGRWTGAMTFYINEVPHEHAWVVPMMSEDGITLAGYACPCGEESHVHLWTGEITKSHPTLGEIIIARTCKYCNDIITSEDFNILRDNEREMQTEVMHAWIAKNITPGMSNLDKVKKVMAEMNSYTHVSTIPSDEQPAVSCLMRTASCLGGNGQLAKYCKAMGIEAEMFSAGEYVGGDHYLTYVWPDGKNGEKLIADGTPGGGLTGPGILWTEDGLWLYCDLLDGFIDEEEYEQWITAEER